MMDGRPYFVAGYTPGGAPYGIYLDEADDDYLTGMITPGMPDKLSDLDLFGPWEAAPDGGSSHAHPP
jgi:hypothetical protein